MITVAYAPGALADLERIVAFLSETQQRRSVARTLKLLFGAVDMLVEHPLVGRAIEHGLRELVISRGRTGYVALYRFDPVAERVLVLGVRHQREAGYVDPSSDA